MTKTAKVDEILIAIYKKDECIRQMKANVSTLYKSVELLSRRVDDIESRSTKCNHRIFGIQLREDGKAGNGMECVEKVKNILNYLPDCSLSRAHRIGQKQGNNNVINQGIHGMAFIKLGKADGLSYLC